MEDCKDIRIDSFIFRRGICNALASAGIFTIGDVIKQREDFIMSILYSRDDFEHLKNSLRPYNEQMRGYKIEDYETRIDKSMFSDKVIRAIRGSGIYSIEDMLIAGSKGRGQLHGISKNEIEEIKLKLIEMGRFNDKCKISNEEEKQ